jgi:hypothetical protein
MNPYNLTQKSSLDRIQLQYYRAIGPVPSVTEDTALHAAGHLYASDRNGLFPVSVLFAQSFQKGRDLLMNGWHRYQIFSVKEIRIAPLLV